MLESDGLMNVLRCVIIFRETHGEHISRQLLTALHVYITLQNNLLFTEIMSYFSYFRGP